MPEKLINTDLLWSVHPIVIYINLTILFSFSSRKKGVFISSMTFTFGYCTTVLSYFYLFDFNVYQQIPP